MNHLPKLSVILPVYNGGSYLHQAIRSVLGQTFADFECIIINDGSTDDSAAIIGGFKDPRIIFINQTNQGLRGALNVGLAQAKGNFIARMDQDDISLPDRFAKQIEFLDTHPGHVLVGTTFAYIDDHNRVIGAFPALLDDIEIKRELYTKTPFGHGTVMLRSTALKQGGYRYRQEAEHVEDYDLWLRFSTAGKYANLPEILYLWRHTPENTTSKHATVQRDNAAALNKSALANQSIKQLIRWPGWPNLRKYRNTSQKVQNQWVEVRRHDAHCSLYLALSWLLFKQGNYIESGVAFSYALLISPVYVLRSIMRRIIRST